MAKTSREWSELYNIIKGMYRPYSVEMSRAEAFSKALLLSRIGSLPTKK